DGENAALQLEAALKLLPWRWPWKPVPQDNESEPVAEQILDLEPGTPLSEAQVKELRAELEKVKPALVEGRKLAGLMRGRYPAVRAEDASNAGATPGLHARQLANLLLADAALLAQDQKLDAALDSCRATLNAGRALGDDPLSIIH